MKVPAAERLIMLSLIDHVGTPWSKDERAELPIYITLVVLE